jgi:hypothetical protein
MARSRQRGGMSVSLAGSMQRNCPDASDGTVRNGRVGVVRAQAPLIHAEGSMPSRGNVTRCCPPSRLSRMAMRLGECDRGHGFVDSRRRTTGIHRSVDVARRGLGQSLRIDGGMIRPINKKDTERECE